MVQIVLHDLLGWQHLDGVVGQLLVECLPKLSAIADRALAPDVVHPECDVDEIRGPQRLQQAIERVVAVLDLPFVATDERQAAEAPDHQVIPARGLDHHRRDMARKGDELRSEEHTSELQSLMRISYAVFCLKKKKSYITSIRTQL